MSNTYLDCTGLNYNDAALLLKRLRSEGFECDISSPGTISVFSEATEIIKKRPDLKTKILDAGQTSTVQSFRDISMA